MTMSFSHFKTKLSRAFYLLGVVVLNIKGVVVGLVVVVVVVKHWKTVLSMLPSTPHIAVMQFPRPSVVL